MEKTWFTRLQSSLVMPGPPEEYEQSQKESAIIVIVGVVCLSSIYFGASNPEFIWALGEVLRDSLGALPSWNRVSAPEQVALSQALVWGWATIFSYLAVPVIVTLGILRLPLRKVGLQKPLNSLGWRTYLGLGFIAAAAVAAASFLPAFTETYPFFVPSDSWGLFILWQSVYGIQILAVEFFFRGFLLLGLRPRFGLHALWLMLIPYFLIHISKPAPEAIASLAAGVVLGLIALRTHSIAVPALLHLFVAWWMDALSLLQRGGLG